VRAITYSDWQAIDEAEQSGAKTGAPRRKFVTVEEMIAALD